MAPVDTLSRHDYVDTTQDNQETAICPEPIIIQALDLTLAWKIQSSTKSDPLVLRALEGLKVGSPLFPRSSMDDWHMTNGHLYFKGRMYIPPHEWQAIVWCRAQSLPGLADTHTMPFHHPHTSSLLL